MKRLMFACTLSMMVATAPIAAAQRGGGGSKKPMVTHGSHAPKTTSHATTPKVHGSSPKSGVSHGSGHGSTKTTTAKAMKAPKTTKGSTKSAKKGTTSTATTTTTTTTTTTAPAPDPTGTTTTTTLTPVQQKLQKNTKLASKLQSRLPVGTDLNTAAAGFRNLGQFVAAVNVSNNLGIPFTELKTRMVDQHMSLGQAIQDARPATTDTTVVAARAQTDADTLIAATSESTTTASTKTKKTKSNSKTVKAKKRSGAGR